MVASEGGRCRIIMRNGVLLPGMEMPVARPAAARSSPEPDYSSHAQRMEPEDHCVGRGMGPTSALAVPALDRPLARFERAAPAVGAV